MNDLNNLTLTVQRLTQELDDTSADVALLTRLRDAETHAARLTIELGDAQAKLSAAMTDKFMAERRAMFAMFRDITVVATVDAKSNGSALAATYTITFEVLAYDSDLRDSVFVSQTVNGFASLRHDVYEYLLTEKPHALPAIILDLAPGDPANAMEIYYLGMKRGYLTQ